MKRATLNVTDFTIILVLIMGGLVVHQKLVAPKLK